jgi:hypothetical protein
MGGYYQYTSLAQLLVPSTIVGTDPTGIDNTAPFTNTLTYPSTYSSTSAIGTIPTMIAPFTGEAINTNFYNLALSAIDNTSRITNIEARSLSSSSSLVGYVTYNGLTEALGEFYSGTPLSISSVNTFSLNLQLDGTTGHKFAFRVAAGSGIAYIGSSVNIPASTFRTVFIGDATYGGTYSSTATLYTYLISKLRYNSNTASYGTSAFNVTGNSSPATYTYPITINKTFMIYINDSYMTGTGAVCTINNTYTNFTNYMGGIANAMNAAVVGTFGVAYNNLFYVAQTGNNVIITANNNRATGGVYEFLLAMASGDTTTTSILGTNSVYGGLGVLNTSGNTSQVETYDLSSFLNFTFTGSANPYYLNLVGNGPSMTMAFLDGDTSVYTTPGFFYNNGSGSFMGLSGPTATSSLLTSHTRYPTSLTYSSPYILNYGGNLNVNNFSCNNFTATGTVTYSGTVSFSGVQVFSNITANGNLTVTGTTQNVGSFDAGTTLSNFPYSTTTRLNYDGILYAALFNGDAIGIHLPTYIYNFAYSSAAPLGYGYYNDASGAIPTNGYGGPFYYANGGGTGFSSPLTLASTNNTVLFNTFDITLSKPASNCQGQGISYDFAIDYGMTTQPFQISFIYTTPNNTNYATGYISVFLYDKSNSNLIPLSTNQIIATNGLPSMFLATFLPSSSTQYRLIFHITTSTDTASYTLQFNAVSVVPQTFLTTTSTMINAWTSYPLTIGTYGTGTTNVTLGTGGIASAQWRRSGSDMEILFNYTHTSAGSAGSGTTYLFPLPAGYTIDQTKLTSTLGTATFLPVGHGKIAIAASTTVSYATMYVNPSLTNISTTGLTWYNSLIMQYLSSLTAETQVATANSGNITQATYLGYDFYAKVPIAQWNVPTNLSTDYQEYAYNSNNITPAANDTTSFAYGANGVLVQSFSTSGVTPITRYVQFTKTINNRDDFVVEFMNPTYPSVWLTANQLGYGYTALSTTNYYGVSTTIVNSTTVSVNFYQAYDVGTGHTWASINTWYWRVRKRSVGNTAEQPPVIRAEYYTTSSSVGSSGTVINCDTMFEDTHTCVSTPASAWKFTAPSPGVYQMEVTLGLQTGKVFSLNEIDLVVLFKNGTAYSTLSSYNNGAAYTTSGNFVITGTKTIRLKPGDYIQAFYYYANSPSYITYALSAPYCTRIIVERIGA